MKAAIFVLLIASQSFAMGSKKLGLIEQCIVQKDGTIRCLDERKPLPEQSYTKTLSQMEGSLCTNGADADFLLQHAYGYGEGER